VFNLLDDKINQELIFSRGPVNIGFTNRELNSSSELVLGYWKELKQPHLPENDENFSLSYINTEKKIYDFQLHLVISIEKYQAFSKFIYDQIILNETAIKQSIGFMYPSISVDPVLLHDKKIRDYFSEGWEKYLVNFTKLEQPELLGTELVTWSITGELIR
jgi:hypothetical protein